MTVTNIPGVKCYLIISRGYKSLRVKCYLLIFPLVEWLIQIPQNEVLQKSILPQPKEMDLSIVYVPSTRNLAAPISCFVVIFLSEWCDYTTRSNIVPEWFSIQCKGLHCCTHARNIETEQESIFCIVLCQIICIIAWIQRQFNHEFML